MTFQLELSQLDITEHGPLAAFLDDYVERGIQPSDRRAFATWVEATVVGLLDQISDLKRELKDLHPVPDADEVEKLPIAADLYHPTKDAANAVLQELLRDPLVADGAVQLEPYNGWIVRVVPGPADLAHLTHRAEIQDGRKRPAPVGKVNPPKAGHNSPVKGASSPKGDGTQGGPAAAPVKGATALVWSIADACFAEKGAVDRGAIIARCEEQGINPSTAATQYSKWKKAKGL